ncbi:MAG TPA: 30S ribosomal protein S7 [Mycoplasmatales bacterium]|jgi:small subunit ribosomal protein S7|nr:30S ribosomal protein S7 [Mycoplasmatales bacterium]
MRKKRLIKKRILNEDFRFSSILVTRFINYLMFDGLKEKSTKIVYWVLEDIKKQVSNLGSLEILNQAIENIRPKLGLKAKRIGGGNVQVPFEMPYESSVKSALKSIISAARRMRQSRADSTKKSLSIEIINAFNKTGEAFKNNQNLQKMAIANLAYSFQKF